MIKNYWYAGFETSENIDDSEEFFRSMGVDRIKGGFSALPYKNVLIGGNICFHTEPFSKRI